MPFWVLSLSIPYSLGSVGVFHPLSIVVTQIIEQSLCQSTHMKTVQLIEIIILGSSLFSLI